MEEILRQILGELQALHELMKAQSSHFNELDDCEKCIDNRTLRKLQRQVLEDTLKHLHDEDSKW